MHTLSDKNLIGSSLLTLRILYHAEPFLWVCKFRKLLPHLIKYIEDITWWREDMNFMFKWQEQYLTSKHSKRV